jgi:F0F1-type ATP synthase membrane subunit c/vacuolar-type H+-ATPase subunit K
MGGAAYILLGLFIFVVCVPCIGIAILGFNLMEKMGRYPSKTPAFQISTFLKLAILEIIAFGMLATLYHLLADYGKGG